MISPKTAFGTFAAVAWAAIAISPASAAAAVKYPVYRPAPIVPWTYDSTFNKATLDKSLIRLIPPSSWKEAPRAAVTLSSARIAQLLRTSPDLRAWAEPIGNQGGIGSCTAWTTAYAMLGWWHNKKDSPSFAPSDWFNPISVYRFTGGSLTASMNRVRDFGAVRARDYSRNEFDSSYTPSAAELSTARPYRFSSWRTLFSSASPFTGGGAAMANLIRNELAAGRPVAIGARVYSDFGDMSGVSKPSTYVYSKASTAEFRGLHAMLALGYDSRGLLLQNSWGKGFADQGYVRVGWTYVNDDIGWAGVADGVIP